MKLHDKSHTIRKKLKKSKALMCSTIVLTFGIVFFIGYLVGSNSNYTTQPWKNNSFQNEIKQDFEKRYDSYTKQEKEFIKTHIDKALSKIGYDADEFDKVAAINDYVYQYFIHKNNYGGAVKLLKDGYAICGGDVLSMAEMLYSIRIKSKYAFLLGIPIQGAHSLLEVYFKDGNRGLFDPTFGIFWYDPKAKRPVSIMELLEDPSICNTTLYKSNYSKRKTVNDPMVVYVDVTKTYSRRIDYKENNYKPCECFSKRTGGGVANEGLSTFVQIPLKPGTVLGEKTWSENSAPPWSTLSVLRDKNGNYISWAYMIGQTMGYDIKHIYNLSGLRPKKRYVLRLYYSKAYDETILSIWFLNSSIPTLYRKIDKLSFDSRSFSPGLVEIMFGASKSDMNVLLNSRGIIILNAIELSELTG